MKETEIRFRGAGGGSGDALGVYVHWPFCLAKCPYCDFNSHVRAEAIDEPRFVAAFATELAHRAQFTTAKSVGSIFFGGGTPSLMRPQTVQAILDAVARHWTLEPDVEVTLEANPTSVEAGRFRGYRAAGVNRVSIGVQSLRDDALKSLGRRHTSSEAIAAVKTATAIFPRYSFDLIYTRPGQTARAWEWELKEALAYAGEHLSIYQLTIEPDTIFERLRDAGKLTMPDEDTGRELFDATQDILAAHGLPAYEVSNHARPGAECQHNLVYWRYGEYLGVGPGAHGRVGPWGQRRAQATERHPEMWLAQVEAEGHGLIEDSALTREEQADEFLLNNLRLREGLSLRRYESLSGRPLRQSQIEELESLGLIARDAGGGLRVTHAGFPLLDTVVADLAA